MSFSRRDLLHGAAATLATIACGGVATAQQTQTSALYTSTTENGIRKTLGIPYAQPPVGPLRFRAPVPPLSGAKNLQRFAPSAMQAGNGNHSEDCLYLNVFSPGAPGSYPVFFWIHGGGFTGGTPNEPLFDGTGFAQDGIVVVTVAYRLGVFGFLDWSPILGSAYADSANNALRDLILALQWVQKNISSFGGDPTRVTIGGESAGAKLSGMLMGIEQAKPLFAQSILESGGAERIRHKADSAKVTHTYLDHFHQIAGSAADPLQASPQTLLEAQRALIDAWPGNFPLRAQSGGAMLPHRAIEPISRGNTRGKRMLLGTNRDESALFLGNHPADPLTQRNLGNVPLARFTPVFENYRKLHPEMSAAQLNIRALSAEEYWLPSIRLAEAHHKGGGTVYFYRLDEEATSGPYKGEAYHSFDLGFVWQHLAKSEPASAQALSTQMHDAWGSFIKGDAPAAAGLPAWPQWNPKSRPTMILKDNSEVEQQPAEAELQLWKGFHFD